MPALAPAVLPGQPLHGMSWSSAHAHSGSRHFTRCPLCGMSQGPLDCMCFASSNLTKVSLAWSTLGPPGLCLLYLQSRTRAQPAGCSAGPPGLHLLQFQPSHQGSSRAEQPGIPWLTLCNSNHTKRVAKAQSAQGLLAHTHYSSSHQPNVPGTHQVHTIYKGAVPIQCYSLGEVAVSRKS